MVKKDFLKKQVVEYINFEESLVEKLSEFLTAFKTHVFKEEDVAFRSEMEKELTVLKDDSEKHYSIVKEILEYIQTSDKNEF